MRRGEGGVDDAAAAHGHVCARSWDLRVHGLGACRQRERKWQRRCRCGAGKLGERPGTGEEGHAGTGGGADSAGHDDDDDDRRPERGPDGGGQARERHRARHAHPCVIRFDEAVRQRANGGGDRDQARSLAVDVAARAGQQPAAQGGALLRRARGRCACLEGPSRRRVWREPDASSVAVAAPDASRAGADEQADEGSGAGGTSCRSRPAPRRPAGAEDGRALALAPQFRGERRPLVDTARRRAAVHRPEPLVGRPGRAADARSRLGAPGNPNGGACRTVPA